MSAGRIYAACLAAITVAILAVYALASLVAFFVIVAGTLWLAGVVGGLAAVGAWADERKGRVEAEGRADDLSDELVSAVAMAESLALELSHADATIRNLAAKVAGAVKPDLRILPPPSREVSDYEWPAIVRAVEGETGGEAS